MSNILKNCFKKLDKDTQIKHLKNNVIGLENIEKCVIENLSDKDVTDIIKANPKNFDYLTDNHMTNKDMVYFAVKYNGEYLNRVPDEVKLIEKIARVAVKSSPKAILYLPNYLVSRFDLIKAITKEYSVFLGLTEEQKMDRLLVNFLKRKLKNDNSTMGRIVKKDIVIVESRF